MGYIMDLRAYVGHRPLIQVGSSVFVEDGQGRVLLQLRSDNHQWSYSAAGSMEPGEVYNVEFAYACRDWSGTLSCQEGEVDDLRFFSLDNLPDGVSEQVKRHLPDWLRHRRAGELPGAE